MSIPSLSTKRLKQLLQECEEHYQELKSTRAKTIREAGLFAARMTSRRVMITKIKEELKNRETKCKAA
jgi:arsenate reductase-like glutaredoxin family protein